MIKTLSAAPKWLEAAKAHAEAKSFDVDVLVSARLAPDQFPFSQQVQVACDSLKLTCQRLTGIEAPKFEDNEKTIAELETRISGTLDFVQGLDAGAFEGADTKDIALPFAEGMVAVGSDYVLEFALPNFYFHVTHIYALLRNNGVPLGKRDFIGGMNIRPAQ